MNQRPLILTGLIAALVLFLSQIGPSRAAGDAAPHNQPGSQADPAVATDTSQLTRALPGASLIFIENMGQFGEAARFQLRGGRGTMWLADDAIWITLLEPAGHSRDDPLGRLSTFLGQEHPSGLPAGDAQAATRQGVNLRLSFVGANPDTALEPFDPLTTTVSYFLGNDPNKWRPDVPVWGGVRYAGLYPGLDLELVGQSGALAPRLVCWATRCQEALESAKLQVEGAEGVALEGDVLRISTAVGDVRLPLLEVVDVSGRPLATNGLEPAAAGGLVMRPYAVAPAPSRLAPNTPSAEGNPVGLIYATFLGGSSEDSASDIAIDGAASAYVTGYTWSSDFPTTPGAFDASHNGFQDAFVVRVSAAGDDLIYATFLGGTSIDAGNGIAVDSTGSAYVAGWTASSDFPATPGAFDTSHNGDFDAFVASLSPAGDDLVYATFLGGTASDTGGGIGVDSADSAFVTGYTSSGDFPATPGAFDTSLNGLSDAFVARFSPAGDNLVYATFLGGSFDDYGGYIAIDGAGSAFVTGSTFSPNFPTTPGAFDTSYNGGRDAFVASLSPAGDDLIYATFLGGSFDDYGSDIAIDSAGSAYVTGHTHSSDFPTTPDAFETSHNGSADAFVVRLNPGGDDLVYATFLGSGPNDLARDIAVDSAGSAYITGLTYSSDFPTTPDAFDTSYNGNGDAFVARFSPAGDDLIYATFLGGSSEDHGRAIAISGAGSAYVTGYTLSSDFPTTPDAFDISHNGDRDAFVARLTLETVPPNQSVYAPIILRP